MGFGQVILRGFLSVALSSPEPIWTAKMAPYTRNPMAGIHSVTNIPACCSPAGQHYPFSCLKGTVRIPSFWEARASESKILGGTATSDRSRDIGVGLTST
jgi:hypothetical protein